MISVKKQKEIQIEQAVKIIREYLPEFIEIGLFGSVARGIYSASSDVDLYVITDSRVDKYRKAELTTELEDQGTDIVFLVKDDMIENMDHLLVRNILKDRKIIDKKEG